MSVLYIALPVALLLAAIAVIAFVVQVRSGQFDDLETPPRRILFDDVDSGSKRQQRPAIHECCRSQIEMRELKRSEN